MNWFARRIHRYEQRRWKTDDNRLVRPFAWGLEHIGGPAEHPNPGEFVRAYAHAGLSARVPLLGSGFLVDESLLSQQGDAAVGIKTALPWARTLDLPANQAFTSAFQNFSGRPADPFAVMPLGPSSLAK